MRVTVHCKKARIIGLGPARLFRALKAVCSDQVVPVKAGRHDCWMQINERRCYGEVSLSAIYRLHGM